MQGLDTRSSGMCDIILVVCGESVVLKMRICEVGLRWDGQNNAKAGPKPAGRTSDWPTSMWLGAPRVAGLRRAQRTDVFAAKHRWVRTSIELPAATPRSRTLWFEIWFLQFWLTKTFSSLQHSGLLRNQVTSFDFGFRITALSPSRIQPIPSASTSSSQLISPPAALWRMYLMSQVR